MERAAFLARVRARLGEARETDAPEESGWGIEIGDPLARFQSELAAVGGHAHVAPEREAAKVLLEWPGAIVLATRESGVPDDVEAVVAEGGGELLWWPEAGVRGAARATVGVTSASWAVAETGSVVVSSAPPSGRAPSLLPAVHVAFVPRPRLLSTIEELFGRVESMPELPSNMVVITGPSKSSDIGMELAVGVHGPKELHVVIVEG